jgi:hypothetical protein
VTLSTLGKDLAATPGSVVYLDDICEVLQYAPSTGMVRSRPVLMVPPQISKYYFMDLSPGRSFVEHAVALPDCAAARVGARALVADRRPGRGQPVRHLQLDAPQ